MAVHDETLRIAGHPVLSDTSRGEKFTITFDGRQLEALAEESIASALRAHGIVMNRTMPDTGSPRGLFCGVGRCPDCMLTVDGELNVRACVTKVRDAMEIVTQQGHGTWKVRG